MPSRPTRQVRGSDPTPDEVLTIKEVAALLKLAEKTVYAMANAGELPAFKIRGQWRIRRTNLERWMDDQPRGGRG
jgi:excisionase family DNA binding protein